jgi:hypothetical protein
MDQLIDYQEMVLRNLEQEIDDIYRMKIRSVDPKAYSKNMEKQIEKIRAVKELKKALGATADTRKSKAESYIINLLREGNTDKIKKLQNFENVITKDGRIVDPTFISPDFFKRAKLASEAATLGPRGKPKWIKDKTVANIMGIIDATENTVRFGYDKLKNIDTYAGASALYTVLDSKSASERLDIKQALSDYRGSDPKKKAKAEKTLDRLLPEYYKNLEKNE